jgi:hypothetical protein
MNEKKKEIMSETFLAFKVKKKNDESLSLKSFLKTAPGEKTLFTQ